MRRSRRREGRSNAARAQLALYPSPHLFGVVTWGCAASRWLARTLNAHPDVFCVHELNAEIAALGDTERLDGPSYLELLGVQGHGYAAAGDVHGISRAGTRSAKEILGAKVSFAVLIREPESRLASQLALFRLAAEYPVWNVDYVDSIVRERDVPLPDSSYESRLVVHGANMLNAICEETEIGPVYRMEDVTASPEHLDELLGYLTDGHVTSTPEWRSSALQIRPSNRHRAQDGRSTLTPWEREVVRRVVRPQAWALYAGLGYEPPDWLD